MEGLVTLVVQLVKQSPYAITLIAALLLFAPANVLDYFQLTSLVTQYRPYISLVFLIAFGLSLVGARSKLASFCRQKFNEHCRLRDHQKRLHTLTDDEKDILRAFIENKTRTRNLNGHSGVVGNLVKEDILVQVRPAHAIPSTPFALSNWAWDYLNTHSHLLLVSPSKAP